jgi:hypothetical protein
MRRTARQTRENRTITIDVPDDVTSCRLWGDGKALLECVLVRDVPRLSAHPQGNLSRARCLTRLSFPKIRTC